MVDFHKGFKDFKGLGDENKEKKEETIVSSREDAVVSFDPPVKSGSLEGFYIEVQENIKDIFGIFEQERSQTLKPKDLLDVSRKVLSKAGDQKNRDECIRLFFDHDSGYKKNYIYEHSVNVGIMTACVAMGLNFSQERMQEVTLAGLFHDIGMMKIPQEMWNKSGKLTKEEFSLVKEHPLYGEGFFTNMEGVPEVVPLIIGQHEEKMDGSGYPGHLKIDNIHFLARMVALVDSYETLTHTRLWKSKILPDKAIQFILDSEMKSYDPYFVKALLRRVSVFPVGTFVKLSSGEICKVVTTNENLPMRPVVNILMDNAKKRVEGGRLLDLSKQFLVHVERCIDEAEAL